MLTVGAADDRYEQEADRVADQVMSAPVGARAFTGGDRVAFPAGGGGNDLQPHELAHVVQQRAGLFKDQY